MSEHVSIEGLEKHDVLAALYNAAAPQGLGFLQASSEPLTGQQARHYLSTTTYFDYLNGRPLKVNLDGDSFEPWGYDRDNGGEGAAAKVIEALRAGSAATSPDPDLLAEKKAFAADLSVTGSHYAHQSVNSELAERASRFGTEVQS